MKKILTALILILATAKLTFALTYEDISNLPEDVYKEQMEKICSSENYSGDFDEPCSDFFYYENLCNKKTIEEDLKQRKGADKRRYKENIKNVCGF